MLCDNFLCLTSEKGKIIVNKCLDKEIYINTIRLEKLLVIIHGLMLARYNQPLFDEKVVAYSHGIMIPKVDRDLLIYSTNFKDKLKEHVILLQNENLVIEEVINDYGNLSAFELDNLQEFKLLMNICWYEKIKNNYCDKKSFEISNELIKKVFKYYDNAKKDEKIFQKRLIGDNT